MSFTPRPLCPHTQELRICVVSRLSLRRSIDPAGDRSPISQSSRGQGCRNFPKILEQSQNSRHKQGGDMHQAIR